MAGLGVMIDGYDPWRAFVIEHTYLGDVLTSWAAVVARLLGVRFTLGPAFALAVTFALLGASFVRRSIQTIFHPVK